MMDIFAQIFRRLPTGDGPSLNKGVFPFKVQINFDIPIFEVHIDIDSIDKWLNLLEQYFFVHNFSNREKITFALLKFIPHVKFWWETFCEQKETNETSLFQVMVTWDSFKDFITKKYYHVGSYNDLYTKWTTRQEERSQPVPKFTNIFNTLCTNLGIKYYEKNLVLKYHDGMHRYIEDEMDFLDISSLGVAYRYGVKIKQKLKQKTWQFGPGNAS